MYGKDFFERADWQHICEFLRYGETNPTEHGTLEERSKKHQHALLLALEQYRKDVLATDWTGRSEWNQTTLSETLSGPLLDEVFAIEELSFQAGLSAGFLLACKMRSTAF